MNHLRLEWQIREACKRWRARGVFPVQEDDIVALCLEALAAMSPTKQEAAIDIRIDQIRSRNGKLQK